LADTTTQFTDLNVAVGDAYEYRIVRNYTNYSATTYTYSGIETQAIEQRGKIILLVDSTFSTTLQAELETLMLDLKGDGWNVIRHDVSRTDSVTVIKNLVVQDYSSDPVNTK